MVQFGQLIELKRQQPPLNCVLGNGYQPNCLHKRKKLLGRDGEVMTFKEKKKSENVASQVKLNKKKIARAIEEEIEVLFRESQHSYWLSRSCRSGDDSHRAFMNGFTSAVSVILIPLWGECIYDAKISLNSRILRTHLANFLSPVLAGKSYRNKDLQFLTQSLTADVDAEVLVQLDFENVQYGKTKQRVGLHTKNRNEWFGKLIDAGRTSILQTAMEVLS